MEKNKINTKIFDVHKIHDVLADLWTGFVDLGH
jgi:hypothetical protein